MISYDSPLKILDMEINFSSQMMMSYDVSLIQLWDLKTDVTDVIFEEECLWKRRRATSDTINSPLKILDFKINFSTYLMMSYDVSIIQLWVLKTDVADVIFEESNDVGRRRAQ